MRVNWTERLEAGGVSWRSEHPRHLRAASRGARRKTGQACSTPQRWEAAAPSCCKGGLKAAKGLACAAWGGKGCGGEGGGGGEEVWSERGADTSDKTCGWGWWRNTHHSSLFPSSRVVDMDWRWRGEKRDMATHRDFQITHAGIQLKHKPEAHVQIDD